MKWSSSFLGGGEAEQRGCLGGGHGLKVGLEVHEETQKGPLSELFPDGGLDGFTGVVQLIAARIVPAKRAWQGLL